MKNFSSQRGQVSLLFLLLIPGTLALLFSVANVSLAVRDRIKLQNSADAAALSGAAWQARGLNQIGAANAVLAGLTLVQELVTSSSEGTEKKNARLAMIGAERRELENIKRDIIRRLPAHLIRAAQESGDITLLGKTQPERAAGAPGNFGTAIMGKKGKWRLEFGFDIAETFDTKKNQIQSVSWRTPGIRSSAGNIFGRMKSGPGHAFSAAQAYSDTYQGLGQILIPDFTAELCPVNFSPDAYSFMKNVLNLAFVKQTREEINENILH